MTQEQHAVKALILAVDDEPGILKLINRLLLEQEYRVVSAKTGEEALQMAEEYRPDLVILDLMLPDRDGLEIMRHLRERMDVPIIILTARGSDHDKVAGLELGADDYLAKPFNPEELTARVNAVLRRTHTGASGGTRVVIGDVEIDLAKRAVYKRSELIRLTRTEWLLLQTLAANAGKVVLHTELLSKVWGPEYRDDLQYLRVWISRLRRKLEDIPSEPQLIKTFQGIGYLLDSEAALTEAARGQ